MPLPTPDLHTKVTGEWIPINDGATEAFLRDLRVERVQSPTGKTSQLLKYLLLFLPQTSKYLPA